jgi:hypothetical protein
MVNVLIAAIAASGGFFAAYAALRKSQRDDRQLLIDQIQEERNWQAAERRKEREEFAAELLKEREQIAAERAAAEIAADRYWSDKAKSREYVAMLRAHINNRQPPPPPHAPAGYLE